MSYNNPYEQYYDVADVLQSISEWESKKDVLKRMWKSRQWLESLERRWMPSLKKALEIAEEYGENYLETKPQIDCILKEIELPEVKEENKRYAYSEYELF